MPTDPPIYIVYTNWKGQKSTRAVIPVSVYYGYSEYHPGLHWLMDAWDVQKEATRTFKMDDIHYISEEPIK